MDAEDEEEEDVAGALLLRCCCWWAVMVVAAALRQPCDAVLPSYLAIAVGACARVRGSAFQIANWFVVGWVGLAGLASPQPAECVGWVAWPGKEEAFSNLSGQPAVHVYLYNLPTPGCAGAELEFRS